MRILIVFWIGIAATLSAQEVSQAHDHQRWEALLQKHVDARGRVHYAGFRQDRQQLQAYLDQLSAHPPNASWSRNEQLAYWINAYNAFTVALVADHYPIQRITDLDGGKPWEVKRIQLGDRRYSLNDIEHQIIRPQFQDPRIHFALNCAARSCPPLSSTAYTADRLNSQLTGRTRAFINDTRFNRIGPEGWLLSRLFEWYAEDFGDVRAFVRRYYRGAAPDDTVPLRYQEYDWRLND